MYVVLFACIFMCSSSKVFVRVLCVIGNADCNV